MGLKLDLGLGINSGGGVRPDYALEFNGTDEYLQIALPNNELLASAGTADFYSSGSAIAGWTEVGTVAWNGTETGKTYTNTITLSAGDGIYSGISKTISGLIIGQKYKLKLRYKPMTAGVQELNIGSEAESGDYFSLLYDADTAGEWNTVSKIFTAVSTTIAIGTVSGIAHLDYASVKRDQGFDLNKDQEQILHSRNALFNNVGMDFIPKDENSNQTCALSTTDKSEGTGSLLITATGVGDTTDHHVLLPSAKLESCVSGKKYTLEGFARSDTASRTITATIGTKTVTSATLSNTAGIFTKFVLNFEATASEVSQDLKLWLSGAGSVYVDKLSLTQSYDMWVINKTKINDDGLFTIFRKATGLGLSSYIGIGIYGTTSQVYFDAYSGDGTSGLERQVSRTLIPNNEWKNIGFLINHTDGIYIGNIGSLTTYVFTTIGKIIENSNAFTIGLNATWYLNGQISHIQIIRFENISQSTFNSALTGLQYPTGGGAEEVLRLTFQNGSSITECLKDYSSKNHTVSGVNVDITNRKRVTA